jgi:hypothetical protein
MTIQYGEGWVDHAHVELFPVSTAAVGFYIPSPVTDHVLLVKYSRARGADLDVRERYDGD